MNDLVLERRARRAYELGRLRSALRLAPFVLAAAAVAVACGRPAGLSCALGAMLLPLTVALAFRGGGAGRGVVPGLLAGTVALAMPLLVQIVGHACIGPACMALCMPSCVVGGAAGGAFIALRARFEERPAPFALAALAVAGLMGALGCTLAGAAGVVGMLAGAVVAGAPVLISVRR
ncbi:MAG: hypothetical protein E6J78_14065 [Deltaproteobacteria bacterium]|nr:MAG: hypothetical protein E6J78_14065 [Deltaproteobacteria bacterium]